MPVVIFDLPETVESVSRNVTQSVVRQFLKITGLPDNAVIQFNGDLGKTFNNGSTTASESRDPYFGGTSKIIVEVNEIMLQDAIQHTHTGYVGHTPAFLDRELRVQVVPMYTPTKISITIRYMDLSRTAVTQWYNNLHVRIAGMLDVMLYEVDYHYSFSDSLLKLLNDVYSRREQEAPYGDTIGEYILKHSTDRLTLATSITGVVERAVVAETQTRIQGFLDDTPELDKPSKEEDGKYSVEIRHTLTYDKPTALRVEYPIMVHNQLLPFEYFEHIHEYDQSRKKVRHSQFGHTTPFFEVNTVTNQFYDSEYVKRIPSYDYFQPEKELFGTKASFYALCSVAEDGKLLLNLTELGDLQIDDEILEFMRESEYPFMTSEYKSIFTVQLYKHNTMQGNNVLAVDRFLDVKAIGDLFLRDVHRVRVGLVVDLKLLDRAALERLLKYKGALMKILRIINEMLRNDHTLRTRLGRQHYTYWDCYFKHFSGKPLTERPRSHKLSLKVDLESYMARTVMEASIVAWKKEDLE